MVFSAAAWNGSPMAQASTDPRFEGGAGVGPGEISGHDLGKGDAGLVGELSRAAPPAHRPDARLIADFVNLGEGI